MRKKKNTEKLVTAVNVNYMICEVLSETPQFGIWFQIPKKYSGLNFNDVTLVLSLIHI